MKSFFKLFVVIAILMVIGLSMTACDDGNEKKGNDAYFGKK